LFKIFNKDLKKCDLIENVTLIDSLPIDTEKTKWASILKHIVDGEIKNIYNLPTSLRCSSDLLKLLGEGALNKPI